MAIKAAMLCCLPIFAALFAAADTNPWPTLSVCVVGLATCLLPPDGDRPLTFFLVSQLWLCLLAHMERGKAPFGDSPLSAAAHLASIHRELHTVPASPEPLFVQILQDALVLCWAACIASSIFLKRGATLESLTLPSRAAFVGLAALFTPLHGLCTCMLGDSHRFYVPLYSMLSLAFEAVTGDPAGDLVAFASGYTFASAALAKLLNSRGGWLTGRALCRHLREGRMPQCAAHLDCTCLAHALHMPCAHALHMIAHALSY